MEIMNYVLEYDATTGGIVSFQPDMGQALKDHEIHITEALWGDLLSKGCQYLVPISTIDVTHIYDDLSQFTPAPPIVKPIEPGTPDSTHGDRLTAIEKALLSMISI